MTMRILQTAAAVAVCAMAGSAWAAVESAVRALLVQAPSV